MKVPDDERLDVFGKLLAGMIDGIGRTRAEVAEATNVTSRTVGRWIAGTTRAPRAKIVAIAKVLGCDNLDVLNDLLRSAGWIDAKDLDGTVSWHAVRENGLPRTALRPSPEAPRVVTVVDGPSVPPSDAAQMRRIADVMTPETNIVWIGTDQTVRDAVWLMLKSKHRRLFVYDNDTRKARGFVYARAVLDALFDKEPDAKLAGLVKVCPVVRETQSVSQVRAELQERGTAIAAVHDERDILVGLVTMNDLVEQSASD